MAGRTILLIEDNEAAQYIFATALRHAGYRVSATRTATEGLRRIAEAVPDAVIVDLGLPDLDGFEVIRQIREAPQTRAVPVVVATVHVFEADEARAHAMGCDLFLRKPLSPSTLVTEIDRIFSLPAQKPSGTVPPHA